MVKFTRIFLIGIIYHYLKRRLLYNNSPSQYVSQRKKLEEKNIAIISDWPLLSRDLNLHVNVRHVLKIAVYTQKFSTIHELWANIEKEFSPSSTSIFKNCSICFQKDLPASFIIWVTHKVLLLPLYILQGSSYTSLKCLRFKEQLNMVLESSTNSVVLYTGRKICLQGNVFYSFIRFDCSITNLIRNVRLWISSENEL